MPRQGFIVSLRPVHTIADNFSKKERTAYAQSGAGAPCADGACLPAGGGCGGAGLAVACSAGGDLSGARADAAIAALCLGGALAGAGKPQRGQHPGSGKLSGHAGAGRLAAGAHHPCGGHRAPDGDRVRNALRGQDVLGRCPRGGIFGCKHRRRAGKPGQGCRAASGGPGHSHRQHGHRGQRRREAGTGSGAGQRGGGGVRPQRGTAADQPDPGVGRLFRPVAGRDLRDWATPSATATPAKA